MFKKFKMKMKQQNDSFELKFDVPSFDCAPVNAANATDTIYIEYEALILRKNWRSLHRLASSMYIEIYIL